MQADIDMHIGLHVHIAYTYLPIYNTYMHIYMHACIYTYYIHIT